MTDRSSARSIKYFFYILGIVAALYVLYQITTVLIIIAIAILIALLFDPFVTILEMKGLNRFVSTLIIFSIIAIIFFAGLSFLIPEFLLQMNQLITTLHVNSLHDQMLSIEKVIYKYLPLFNFGELTKRTEEFISTGIVNSIDKITTLLSSIVSIVTLLVIVPFITFFILKDSKKIMHSFLKAVPNKYFEMSYWILKKITYQLGRFVRGWIFDATFVGISCGFGYHTIGINNALALGLISGIGHLIPYFGPIIGGVPAIFISIIQYGDFSHVPYIVLLIVIVYIFDNGVIQPFIFSKSVDMHPVVIILLILIGSELLGVAGMLLAIPFATVVRTAAKEIYFAYRNYKIAKL